MYHPFKRLPRLSAVALILLAFGIPSATAQSEQAGEETAVTILRTESSRHCAGFSFDDGVVTEESFRKIVSTDGCAFLEKLNVDFSAHTLIAVSVLGDCFVRASVEITRNDAARKYTCRIKKRYGGCRAGGRFERWAVVEKMRPDYQVEFVTTTVKEDEEPTEPVRR